MYVSFRNVLMAWCVMVPASAFGGGSFINTWLVTGTFENGADGAGLDQDWIGEGQVQPVPGQEAGGQQWTYFDDRLFSRNYDDYQDLYSWFRIRHGRSIAAQVAYAHVYVHSPAERVAQLRIGADSAFKAWLNGQPAAESRAGTPCRDQTAADVHLRAGWNRLLVKVANRTEGRLGFYCRICGSDGAALPGLTFSPVGTAGALRVGTGQLPTAWREWPYVAANARKADNPGLPPLRKPEVALHASAFLLTAGGGSPPYRWSLRHGRLPTGLRLLDDGTIEGTPDRSASLDTYRVSVNVQDASGASAEKELAIELKERPNKWYEESRLTALIHCPEKMPPGEHAAFARLMRRQGYGVGMIISYNNGDHAYRWPSPFDPDNAFREVAAEYKKALEAEGIRFGMYIGNFDGPNHGGFDGALRVVEDACRRYKPAAFWFDWAGWDGTSLDALFSVIRTLSPEAVIVLNGVPTMSNGDWDILVLEGWGAWGERHWTLWPFPVEWPKRTALETWRLVADPAFEYSKGVEPDWQAYLRQQIAIIGEGCIANIDHSPTIRTPIRTLDESPTIQAHKRMADWADPPGGRPLYPSYTNVNPGPLMDGAWGYDTISLDRRTVYLHMLVTPYGKTGKPAAPDMTLGPMLQTVKAITWLNAGKPVDFRQDGDRLSVELTDVATDPIDTILRVELAGPHPETPPKAPAADSVTGNLAYHKPARLLSLDGTRNLPASAWQFAAYGVDGVRFTSAQGGDQWPWTYHVDLQRVHPIGRVVIHFGSGFATEYELLLSTDGQDWSRALHVTDATGGTREHVLQPAPARYLRIRALKPDGPNQPGVQMSIAELEVYE